MSLTDEVARSVHGHRQDGQPARPVLSRRQASQLGAAPQLTDGQRQVVDHAGGPLLVLGGPGTGKTTALVEAMVRHAEDDRRPLLLTFSRRMVETLRTRIGARVGHAMVAPAVMTFHGFCHAMLQRFGESVGVAPDVRLLTAPEQEFRVREVLGGQRSGAWPQLLLPASGTRTFSAELRHVLARARQLGLDPDDLEALGESARRPDWAAAGRFFAEYLDVLDAEGVIDYAELVHRSRIALTDDGVLAEVRAGVGAVFVDEFHDTDPAQAALLRQLVGGWGDVVLAGDPDQSVYGFRGSLSRGLLDAPDLFGDGTGIPTLTLDEGLRLPVAVSRATRRVADRLPFSRPLTSQARERLRGLSPTAVRGQVTVRTFDTAGAEAEHIAEMLRSAHLHEGLPWEAMAVLVRTGRRTLPGLARALNAGGVPVEVAGDEIALAAELAVRPLLLALEVAGRGCVLDADEAVRLLQSPLGGLDAMSLRRVGRALRAADWAELGGIGAPQPSTQLLRRALMEPTVLEECPDTLDVRRARRLAALLHQVADMVARRCSAHDALWALWTGTSWPEKLRTVALGGGENARRAARDLDAVCALFDAAQRSADVRGSRGVEGFLAEVAGQQIPADTQRASDGRGLGVRLMTAHRSKGLEWPLVVVANVQEGSWPDLRHRGGLLEGDRIERSGEAPAPPGSQRLADERRLFYLACTRASDRLVVTAVSGTEGEGDQPSRFLGELGEPVVHVPGRPQRPLSLNALVGELRRVCVDDEAPAELRRAAASRLAQLADATDDQGRPLVPAADPQRWWGLRELTRSSRPVLAPTEPLTLTGSAVAALLECPRKWFLDRRVRAEGVRGSAASLGTIIHTLAERALADGLSGDELSTGLTEVWHQLQFEAPWMSVSERVEADAAIERFLAWQEAHEQRDVLGVEVSFEVPVQAGEHQITLRGAVDRLERDAAGRLRIIDFKTGRTAPTKRAAAVADQLGVYQLAAQLGAFEALAPGERRVADAQLVYVRHQEGPQPFPKVFTQPSLDERPHLTPSDYAVPSDADGESDHPTWVHHRLAQAGAVVRAERFHARLGGACSYCPFATSCPAQRGGREVVS